MMRCKRQRRHFRVGGKRLPYSARECCSVSKCCSSRILKISRAATREKHGKTLIESRGDVRRGIEMVEFACGIPSLLGGETIENVARAIDCETIRQPLGVCVGITPFNFPAMVPLWMYPVALACGNTFVLKPSEKVPLTAIMIGRL